MLVLADSRQPKGEHSAAAMAQLQSFLFTSESVNEGELPVQQSLGRAQAVGQLRLGEPGQLAQRWIVASQR